MYYMDLNITKTEGEMIYRFYFYSGPRTRSASKIADPAAVVNDLNIQSNINCPFCLREIVEKKSGSI